MEPEEQLNSLMDRAIAQDKGKIAFLCATAQMCDALRRRLQEMAVAKQVSHLLSEFDTSIYVNWLYVRFFPYSYRGNLALYGFDECEVIDGPKLPPPEKFDREGFYA